eukprot:CAMPEP_0194746202 /NCGR_PEP_ID=MMETSP0323_2-20130528/69_1 /TAXON_ID=2866 ORGANISM="Crypthecodinium cohnii, Strain Seligo" /NCGR_SAMPLE_ID=MMETSP0323_2 /ASSEMBLY_ACC=CAM_ASM_000346 /LENGTH=34 /DNA_ID= /DNA_START= /DNA_END= /DNA_ORIENTATION=
MSFLGEHSNAEHLTVDARVGLDGREVELVQLGDL